MSAAHAHDVVVDSVDRARLGRRAQLLAGASVAYNVVEAIIAISAGLAAGSVALVGFGLDSTVEISSGLIILWQFRHRLPESREHQALRLMALSYFGLAAYIACESVRALVTGREPDTSPIGIALAAASRTVMPVLSWAQRQTGRALGSGVVVADSTQTLLCTYLSAVLLVGLVLNATQGWYWADPIAGWSSGLPQPRRAATPGGVRTVARLARHLATAARTTAATLAALRSAQPSLGSCRSSPATTREVARRAQWAPASWGRAVRAGSRLPWWMYVTLGLFVVGVAAALIGVRTCP